ncbi:MAG: fructosamine kinase [Spirochaetaceae bacterium]|nr:MAG: fructosamine kinase [Spirochaetaceae bacterium]
MNIPVLPDTQNLPELENFLSGSTIDRDLIHVKRSGDSSSERMLACEWVGLRALEESGEVPVPTVYGLFRDRGAVCLVMDRIRRGSGSGAAYRDAGAMLARMHRSTACETAGFEHDNYIGLGRQTNGWMDSWPRFFADRRISPQVEHARKAGLLEKVDELACERLCARMGEILPDSETMSLLHGDLWSGNLIPGEDERAYFIDPAVYYGHREADLAMTRLFGGFPAAFYDAYERQWPLLPGNEERVPVYNLYHLLNHLNIFGPSYRSSVRSVLKRF